MKPVSGKRLCKALERAGWSLVRINSSHHLYHKPGQPELLSVPVHGNRDLKIGLQRRLMSLAGLTDADL